MRPEKQPEEKVAAGSGGKISALLLACCVTLDSLFISSGPLLSIKQKMGFILRVETLLCSV